MAEYDEEKLRNNLAKHIRLLRYQRRPKLSQEMLAKKLGLSQKSLSRYERAGCLPPAYVIAAMAKFFGLSMDELLYNPQKGEKTNENLTHDNSETNSGGKKQTDR